MSLFALIFRDIHILYGGAGQTVIFKTIGTHSPEAYNLREIESPAPPFQCCVPIFILFEAPTVCAYNTTTLNGEGVEEGRNVRENVH